MSFNMNCRYSSQTYFIKTLVNILGILNYFPSHLSKSDFFPIVLPYPYSEKELAPNDLIKVCFNLSAKISPDWWKCFPLMQTFSSLSNTLIHVIW